MKCIKNNNWRQIVFIALAVLQFEAGYANNSMSATSPNALKTLVEAYKDSLHNISQKCLSGSNAHQENLPDGRYYKLFVPTTFYHSAANNKLSILNTSKTQDVIANEIDNILLDIYLYRPDLVVLSENRIKAAGSLREEIETPITQEIELTKEEVPIPEAPIVAPSDVVVKKPNFWKFGGDGYLQFLQNYISGNWHQGGESNYSMVGSLTLTANYNNKSKIKFDNKLELRLGFQTSRDDTIHKFKTNNDQIRYTGKLGLQATKRWYYTLQVIANTQFTKGLKSNDRYVYSDFMSPFNLSLGIGMDYSVSAFKNRLTGSVNLSALAFNFKYVDRKELAHRHGIAGNHRTSESFGSQLTVDLKWKITDQISWKTRIYGYTSYARSLIEWENTIALQVSKYISANIYLYPRFDDSAPKDEKHGYLQFKEYSSLGFSYTF